MTRKHKAPPAPDAVLSTSDLPPATPELGAAVAEAPFSYEAWRAERQAKGREVMQGARRAWAAMQGWDRVATQEDWDRLKDQAAEDWESGAALLTMLGGERYLEPERAALCLMLWRDFLGTYHPGGPAEYLVVAMAVLGFDHFLRVNGIIHNIEARLEGEFFGLGGLHTDRDPHPFNRSVRGLTASEVVEQLGQDLLPLLDRLNRLVIRNLRALRELKGAGLAVTVANYGQVNVGQTQTNRAAPAARARRGGRTATPRTQGTLPGGRVAEARPAKAPASGARGER